MISIFGYTMPSFHLWAIPLTFFLGVALGWAARGAIIPKK
jgi:ABC-type dipeptide/oligopeptide/nickel transport system permease component